ncbi:MAG: helix-turn-helix domain-containing protein [Promethearchaeota archaeon]
MLEDLERLEILNAYQYDQKNFFSMQRIKFKPGMIKELERIVKYTFKAHYFQLLEQVGDEIVCIIKQRRTAGFWPMLEMGPWAFLFPLVVDPEFILINVLAEEDFVYKLYEFLDEYKASYRIVGTSSVNTISKINKEAGAFSLPAPGFTDRQRDIASYAAKHGFFEEPKKITARQIADHFGISESAVNNNLRKAQHLAMKYFFGGKY